MKYHQVVCKCFLSLQGGLLKDKREMLTETQCILQKIDERNHQWQFISGYTHFTMGKFIIQRQKEEMTSECKREQDWEFEDISYHYKKARQFYTFWSSASRKENANDQLNNLILLELVQVLSSQYTEHFTKDLNIDEVNVLFDDLDKMIDKLDRYLGLHEEALYAAKRVADIKRRNGRLEEAAIAYKKLSNIYELNFGSILAIQQMLILRDWSECDKEKKS